MLKSRPERITISIMAKYSKKCIILTIIAAGLLTLTPTLAAQSAGTAPAAASPASGDIDTSKLELELVTLALRWEHQFQFAGYYAAIVQGYYAQEGLQVQLITPADGLFPMDAVLGGKAEYGIGSAELLTARYRQQKPLVLLASIYQHSGIILLSRKDHGQLMPQDYVGKTIMSASQSLPEIQLMLLKEGIDLKTVKFRPNADLTELLTDQVDGLVCYLSNEPFIMSQRGIEPQVMRPISYGIDFYGDSLFTSEQESLDRPGRTERFIRASLRGWDYALQHPEELVQQILEMPGVRERGKTAELLRYEAQVLEELIQPELITIGHINPARWQHMADNYAEFGLIPAGTSIDGFIFQPELSSEKLRRLWWRAGFIMLAATLLLMIVLIWNQVLRRVIRRKTQELNQSRIYLQSIFDTCPDSIFIHNAADGRILDVNEACCRQYSYSREQLLASSIAELSVESSEYNQLQALQHLERTKNEGRQTFEWHARRNDGSSFWGEITTAYFTLENSGRYIVMVRDISERKKAEELIRRQLAEKDLLLKEVHHRIKNNLASIRSLINLQAAAADSPEISEALQKAGNRIESMYVLYQKLLNDSDYQSISVKTYVQDLVGAILALSPEQNPPELTLEIEDGQLEPKKLFLLGGLINEFMTNSLKHAGLTVAGNKTRIAVRLLQSQQRWKLILQDNGPGLPAAALASEEIQLSSGHHFGLMLMRIMGQQLDGKVQLYNANGARCELDFPATIPTSLFLQPEGNATT